MCHIHFTVIHEVEHRLHVTVLDPLEVEEGVAVRVFAEHGSEKGRAGGEDHLVSLYLLLFAGQRHVEEILVLPQLTERTAYVAFKVIPSKAELFRRHCKVWLR